MEEAAEAPLVHEERVVSAHHEGWSFVGEEPERSVLAVAEEHFAVGDCPNPIQLAVLRLQHCDLLSEFAQDRLNRNRVRVILILETVATTRLAPTPIGWAPNAFCQDAVQG